MLMLYTIRLGSRRDGLGPHGFCGPSASYGLSGYACLGTSPLPISAHAGLMTITLHSIASGLGSPMPRRSYKPLASEWAACGSCVHLPSLRAGKDQAALTPITRSTSSRVMSSILVTSSTDVYSKRMPANSTGARLTSAGTASVSC